MWIVLQLPTDPIRIPTQLLIEHVCVKDIYSLSLTTHNYFPHPKRVAKSNPRIP